MDGLKKIQQEITQLIFTIESEYPELYRFLDEEPITIPNMSSPEIDSKIMQDYLDGLQQIFEHYKETRMNK
ncbi:MAG: hypothetical protein OEW87_06780 [Flavobacteriaceae bacterium]|nr:hypothetical protein [Flavobacteriaceae bacterium]